MFTDMLMTQKSTPRDMSSVETGIMAGAPCPVKLCEDSVKAQWSTKIIFLKYNALFSKIPGKTAIFFVSIFFFRKSGVCPRKRFYILYLWQKYTCSHFGIRADHCADILKGT